MSTSQSKLLIRADAGPTVGTGHVMRTLALGQSWARNGGQVTFVCGDLPRGLVKRIENENFDVYQIQNGNCDGADAKDTSEIASVVQPGWIVLDGYRFDDTYQQSVRAGSRARLLVVDDYGHASHSHADLILNQNVYASSSQYANSSRAKVLAGPQFVLLRNEFDRDAAAAMKSKKIVAEARRILVTFGGADPDNWTLKTLQILSDLNRKKLIVDCVAGACYTHFAELQMFKKSANMSLRIHRNIDRMSQLMERVDLAITAGGSTCYELARCGVPSIVASIAANQIPIARTLHDAGVMVSIDENGSRKEPCKLNGTRLKQAIRKLINDPDQRRSMSQDGRRLVDGKGATRIIRTMSASAFSVRAATEKDAEVLWRWQNDPEVRSVALNKKPRTAAAFASALRKQVADPSFSVWIAENEQKEPVAGISFAAATDTTASCVSVIVNQAQRGRGLGTILIRRACEQFFNTGTNGNCNSVIAQVKAGNVACEKAFRGAGFAGIQPAIVNGKMAHQFELERAATDSKLMPVPRRKSA